MGLRKHLNCNNTRLGIHYLTVTGAHIFQTDLKQHPTLFRNYELFIIYNYPKKKIRFLENMAVK